MIFRLIVWLVMIFGGTAAGFYLDGLWFGKVHNDFIFHAVSLIIGLLLLTLVIRISKNTGRTLARYGKKGKIKRGETNVLVKEGPYKYMRHPMHLGLMLFPFALAFIVGSPSFVIVVAPAEVIFMLIMIKLFEEPEAIEKFGEEYLEYKKNTPGFCFRLECLKELWKSVPKRK